MKREPTKFQSIAINFSSYKKLSDVCRVTGQKIYKACEEAVDDWIAKKVAERKAEK